MSFRFPFTKMQGLGNDFVVIDELARPLFAKGQLTPELARRICDRRFGVGCDQILWLKPPQTVGGDADVRMEILNADGTEAEMCGNGIRAVGVYLRRPELKVETLAGLKVVRLVGDQVEVDMGQAGLGAHAREGEMIRAGGSELLFHEVSMGNPHAVIFVPDAAAFPVAELGAAIEKHARFPKRTNVEFVQVTGPTSVLVRVWERGAGITQACGTGACAAAVAAILTKRAASPIEVALPGGKLLVRWGGEGTPVMMTGPACEVFRGEMAL